MSKPLRLRYRHTSNPFSFLIQNDFHFVIFNNGIILTTACILTDNNLFTITVNRSHLTLNNLSNVGRQIKRAEFTNYTKLQVIAFNRQSSMNCHSCP